MTSYFPDVNVWLALSVADHAHHQEAWNWRKALSPKDRLIFSRTTQLSLLRLLMTASMMGNRTLSMGRAWAVFDRWMEDPAVEFPEEPRGTDLALRTFSRLLTSQTAPKACADCYLAAYASQLPAALVTFDKALAELAHRGGCRVVRPA